MGRIKEPLIRITRREDMPWWKSMLIRLGAVVAALCVSAAFISAAAPSSKGFFGYFGSLFSGTFGTERRIWMLLQNTALLLMVSVALVVAFKMRFWNLGGKLPDPVVWLLMFVSGVLAGAVWACIPALFKAFFNTNESLFTLMMNYIAVCLVAFFISLWYPEGTGAMPPLSEANLPTFGSGQMGRTLPILLVAVVITAAIYIYLRFHKHGYEISVVSDSKNTAKYAGINVKKVIIRTMILSGALCGIVGFILVGSVNHMVSTTMDDNMGFTGIMVAWMGNFNPLIMAAVSLFIIFLSRGMAQVCTDFGYTSEALSDTVIGIIYFFFIGCEFFIRYKVHINRRKLMRIFRIKKGGKDGGEAGEKQASETSETEPDPPEPGGQDGRCEPEPECEQAVPETKEEVS